MASLIARILTGAKSALLERGTLICRLNAPFFRASARRVAQTPPGEKIRVGFMIQVPNNWAVLQSVYEAAKADPDLEPVVLLMPELEFRWYVWTPRWTLDARLGATSFFTYREEMIRWAEEDPTVDLVWRPHPLALDTYVREGWMTAAERDAYMARFAACANAAVDRESTYYDTFWSSDLLITDVSSMLMDYMLTGKPILYCPTPAGDRLSDDPSFAIRPLLPGMYIVRSMDDIRRRAEAIRRGGGSPAGEAGRAGGGDAPGRAYRAGHCGHPEKGWPGRVKGDPWSRRETPGRILPGI